MAGFELFKKLLEKLKHPHGIALIIFYVFTAFATVAMILCLTLQVIEIPILDYITIGTFAICLGYFVYTIVYFAPKIKAKVIGLANKFKFTRDRKSVV